MKYDFETVIEREGKDATAIDGIGTGMWGFAPDKAKPGFDEIPMWVADMNFATCPSITKALEERIKHPLYGYFMPSDRYYESIINWQTKRNGYAGLTREMIGYENGVHGCIISAINALSEPGDSVLVHSPTYVGFIGDLLDTGRRMVLSPLKKDADGIWRMDFEDMDRKIREKKIRLAIFCSPHNPTGRVWERWELEKAMEIFRQNDVTVISDEIWSDIIFEGHRHIPTALVSEDASGRTVGIYAPSKTFNLAGLIGSYHIIPNPLLREKVTNHGDRTHYNEMNVLSMHALIGAYEEPAGFEWTDELCEVLEENCRYAADYINNRLDGCSVSIPQGTYMLFMDCSVYLEKAHISLDELIKRGWDYGVAWEDGRKFAWDNAIRLNVALPMERLKEAFRRMEEYILCL